MLLNEVNIAKILNFEKLQCLIWNIKIKLQSSYKISKCFIFLWYFLIYIFTMSRKSSFPRIRSNAAASKGKNNGYNNDRHRLAYKTDLKIETSATLSLSKVDTTVYDCCCFVFHCATHNKVLLTKGTIKFFTHAPLNPTKTWSECSIETALKFLMDDIDQEKCIKLLAQVPFDCFKLIHLFRFQLPQSQHFITRLTYLVQLGDEKSNEIKCCKNSSAFEWFPLQEVVSSAVSDLWGPEVQFFTSLCENAKKANDANKTDKDYASMRLDNAQVEYSLADVFKYIDAQVRPDEEKPLVAMLSNLAVHDIERLYAHFIEVITIFLINIT